MSIPRNNSTKSRKIIEIFPRLYVGTVGQNDALSVIKFLNLKEIFCLREKPAMGKNV